MPDSERLQTNRFAKGAAIWTIALLAGTTSTGRAAEPLKYYGFDTAAYSATAQEGLEEIFSGRLFHNAAPVPVASGSETKLGYDFDTPEGQYYALGRFPSPPNRKAGGANGFGLGESVFVRDKAQVFNINCFGCHAGVVNGQVVAGLTHNRINQSDSKMLRTRGDNFGPYRPSRY